MSSRESRPVKLKINNYKAIANARYRWLGRFIFGLIGLWSFQVPVYASVNSIGDMFDWLTSGNYSGLGAFMFAVSYLAGIGFVITAMNKAKHYKENPTQIPLSAPLALFVVGILLVYIPGFINSGGFTLLGSSGVVGGYTGAGVCGLPGTC